MTTPNPNWKELAFGKFDFQAVNDPAFKEDSVREEIIAPLLRSLGYTANGAAKIVRSRPLAHPYVLFGTTKRKLTVVPDYLLEVDGKPAFVLDAKKPSEEITRGDHVAQTYSYAIHSEIRVRKFGLCNGHQLSLFHIDSVAPKHVYNLATLSDASTLDLTQKLNPRTIRQSESLEYSLDGGTYLIVAMDWPVAKKIYFPKVPLSLIAMRTENDFCVTVVTTNLAEVPLAFTFDFDRERLHQLLNTQPSSVQRDIVDSFKRAPFYYQNGVNPPTVPVIEAELPREPEMSTAGEMFIPLVVTKFF